MATPESTAIERLVSVVANILNREITVANDIDLLLRIVNRFAAHWQAHFNLLVADPTNPTNNEKAEFFILKMKEFGQDILRAEAKAESYESYESVIEADGDAAASDLS